MKTPSCVHVEVIVDNSEIIVKTLNVIARVNRLNCSFKQSDRGVLVNGDKDSVMTAIHIYKSFHDETLRCEVIGHA